MPNPFFPLGPQRAVWRAELPFKCSIFVAILLLIAGCQPEVSPDPFEALSPIHTEVDVFVGTGGEGFGVGSSFPGPALPFGMARPGPDSQGEVSTLGALHCSGYRASDPYIAGFSHLRMHGTGIPDYGSLRIAPSLDWEESHRQPAGYRLGKVEGSEEGRPGYYRVDLDEGGETLRAELTAGLRAAHHRYTFPEGAGVRAGLVLDFSAVLPGVDWVEGGFTVSEGTSIRVDGWTRFSGPYSERHGGERVYFHVRFDPEPIEIYTWDGAEDGGDGLGLWARFDASSDPTVEVQVGISFVAPDGAESNLEADLAEGDFDATLAAAEGTWEEALSAFALAGGSDTDRSIFASAAYHSLLMPTLFTDSDGRYRGFDGELHLAQGWTYYTDFSLWDTYRTLHPLFNLVAPDRQADFVRSLVTMANQGEGLPRWPLGSGPTGGMIGDPATIVLADAWLRGVAEADLAGEDLQTVLLASASARDRAAEMEANGFLSVEGGSGSVSLQLEHGWADHALLAVIDRVGILDSANRKALADRAAAYASLWDEETGFFRPKNADGSFVEPFEPLAFDEAYVEGNAWQYLWMPLWDVEGLAERMGSNDVLIERLGTFFASSAAEEDTWAPDPYYWHGNEPDIHAPFLFALAGNRDLSAFWSRWVEDSKYGLGPSGLDGNDDAGTLSAWYLWSAAGLYPVAGSLNYILSEPRFDAVRLGAGPAALRTARVIPTEARPEGVLLNDDLWGVPTVSWVEVRSGADLRFVLR